VDRTTTWQGANGNIVSFTIDAPRGMPGTIYNVSPCNGAGGCDDFTNINNTLRAIQSSNYGPSPSYIPISAPATLQLSAGNYYINATAADYYNVGIAATDLTITGAGLDINNIPLTHLYFSPMAAEGYFFGAGNRILTKYISIDFNQPNAVPLVYDASTQRLNVWNPTLGTAAGPYYIKTSMGIGGISGTTLTITSVTSGVFTQGQYVWGVSGYPQIVDDLGGGIYTVTNPNSVTAAPGTAITALSVPSGIMAAYNFTTGTYIMKNGARESNVPGGFNPNFTTDGLYYYQNPVQPIPDATGELLYFPPIGALFIGTGGIENISFENVSLYGGSGTGFVLGADTQGVRLTNVTVTKKPTVLLCLSTGFDGQGNYCNNPGEQPRYYSIRGDSDGISSMGNILIENSEFGFVDDDTFYGRGISIQLTSLTSTTGFSLVAAETPFTHPPAAGDVIQFYDQITLLPIGSPVALTANSYPTAPGTWTVTFPSVPELAPYIGLPQNLLPFVREPLYDTGNFAFINSCSHDNHGRAFSGGDNSLIKNSVFANNYYNSLQDWASSPGVTTEGSPGNNVTLDSNKIIGSGQRFTDYDWLGNPIYLESSGACVICISAANINQTQTPAGVMSDIQITNNFISNTPGVAIYVSSTANLAIIGNTIVDANAIPFIAVPGCSAINCPGYGSIWVSHSNDVYVNNNTYLGTTSPYAVLSTIGNTKLIGSMRFQ
jgi:hypothetical protein